MIRIAAILLFAAQIFLTFKGVTHFGQYFNPVLLLLVSLSVPLLYLISAKKSGLGPGRRQNNVLPAVFLFLAVALCGYIACLYEAGFQTYDQPVNISDVIPQLEILWDRFAKGEQPYYRMDLPNSKPFPVYMPAHWLPIGIAKALGFDLRWIGLIMLFFSMLALVYYNTRKKATPFNLITSVLILPVVLYYYRTWGEADLFVTFETPVAAYYLLLALGLIQRNLVFTFAGIILCVLSRYTLIFWFPLFAFILFRERPLRPNIIAWSSVIFAVILFYILPFIARQPDIFKTGLSYHNYAAAFEWEYGAWTFEHGIYFAPHFKKIFSGTYEELVLYSRIAQGSLMILLNIIGAIIYRKFKDKINFYDYSLIALYIFLVCFYAFSPLTYRYYLLTTLLLSGVICMRIINFNTNRRKQQTHIE